MCRSPYAEFIMKRLISESPALKDKVIEVRSSAVFNKSSSIHPRTLKCLVEEGFDREEAEKFKPTFKRGSEKLFAEADVIIGMSEMHRIMTPKKYRSKFITLSEAAIGYYVKIPDPFVFKSDEKYNETLAVIKEYLKLFAGKLEQET